MDPARTARSITLPTTAAPAEGVSSMHVFALSLQPVVTGAAVRLRRERPERPGGCPTARGRRAQIVDVSVLNVGTEWVTERSPLTVTVSAAGVDTVVPASIRVLAPGQEARVEAGIDSPGLPAGTALDAEVRVAGGAVRSTVAFSLTAGIPAYEVTDASLSRHQAPYWFHSAKFGIFIHWGVYSVPAWAPVGKQYAEWYWEHMQDPNNPTYAHHRGHYGEDFAYDDFIPQFTAEKFDPRCLGASCSGTPAPSTSC